jgi:hypothetical protein
VVQYKTLSISSVGGNLWYNKIIKQNWLNKGDIYLSYGINYSEKVISLKTKSPDYRTKNIREEIEHHKYYDIFVKLSYLF